jgi:putative colanic acid biosynthesis UDP-glucose lipid carrier transferase
MQDQSPAVGRFKLRDAKHNAVTQIADFFFICASLWMVVTIYPAAGPWATMHSAVASFAGVLFCFVGASRRLYQVPWLRHPLTDELKAVAVCWAWVVSPLVTLGFATKALGTFSRIGTFSWVLLALALIMLYRILARARVPAARSTRRRAAIAGISAFSERVAHEIEKTPALSLSLVGVFDDRAVAREDKAVSEAFRNVGSFTQLVAAAREGSIDVIYIALPLRAELRIKELIRRLQDTTVSVYLAFDFASLEGEGYHRVSQVGGLPVVPLLSGMPPSMRTRALKVVRGSRGNAASPARLVNTSVVLATSQDDAALDSDVQQRDGTSAIG